MIKWKCSKCGFEFWGTTDGTTCAGRYPELLELPCKHVFFIKEDDDFPKDEMYRMWIVKMGI